MAQTWCRICPLANRGFTGEISCIAKIMFSLPLIDKQYSYQ